MVARVAIVSGHHWRAIAQGQPLRPRSPSTTGRNRALIGAGSTASSQARVVRVAVVVAAVVGGRRRAALNGPPWASRRGRSGLARNSDPNDSRSVVPSRTRVQFGLARWGASRCTGSAGTRRPRSAQPTGEFSVFGSDLGQAEVGQSMPAQRRPARRRLRPSRFVDVVVGVARRELEPTRCAPTASATAMADLRSRSGSGSGRSRRSRRCGVGLRGQELVDEESVAAVQFDSVESRADRSCAAAAKSR